MWDLRFSPVTVKNKLIACWHEKQCILVEVCRISEEYNASSVSEEYNASIFRMEELVTKLPARRTSRLWK
jgi:hypothetical protein